MERIPSAKAFTSGGMAAPLRLGIPEKVSDFTNIVAKAGKAEFNLARKDHEDHKVLFTWNPFDEM